MDLFATFAYQDTIWTVAMFVSAVSYLVILVLLPHNVIPALAILISSRTAPVSLVWMLTRLLTAPPAAWPSPPLLTKPYKFAIPASIQHTSTTAIAQPVSLLASPAHPPSIAIAASTTLTTLLQAMSVRLAPAASPTAKLASQTASAPLAKPATTSSSGQVHNLLIIDACTKCSDAF